MSTEPQRVQVRELIGRMSPNGPRPAAPEDRLVEDLGYDSLAVIELSLQLESSFGLTDIGSNGVPDIKTVADVENLVVQILEDEVGAA